MKRTVTGEFFSARKAIQMALVDELGDRSRAIEPTQRLDKVSQRLDCIRPRRGLAETHALGLASSIVEEAYLYLEDRLFPEQSLPLRA